MSKRTSLKGKGIDIFTNPEETKVRHTTTPAHQHTSKPATKATFYLTEQVIDGLDEIWMKVRRREKDGQKISKSSIVTRVLDKAIKDLRNKPVEDIIELLN